MSFKFLLLQGLNGVSFGALLFLLASGFTLVFGLMRVVNLAHGAFYLLGGYVGIVTASSTGSFLVGLLAGSALAAVLGLGTDLVLLRRERGHELREVLLTVGLALVIADISLAIFGGNPRSISVPDALTGSVRLGSVAYPTYRLFVTALALVVWGALFLVHRRTRLGAVIRAGVDDREMAGAMGINVDRAFTGMFVFGAALAGLAGATAAGLLTMRPGADTDILLLALVVVVVGGLGSVEGAALGSVFIGLVDAFSKVWIPEFSSFAVFAPMALVLMLRPQGFFGRAAS